MRILWVKVGGLWPLNTGGRQRTFNIISELSRRHQVIVITTHGPSDDPYGLTAHLPFCERVYSLPYAFPKRGSLRFAAALIASWFSKYPVDLWKSRIPAVRKEVSRLLTSATVDLCIADFLCAMPNVHRSSSVPIVLFEHNVEYMIWKRLSEVETSWRRLLLKVEWQKMRRCEALACARARLTVAVSEVDRSLLTVLAPGASIVAVPTGVDTSYYSPNGSEADTGLVFTGSMDWYPNEDAIIHFIESILPPIRSAIPKIALTVVGRNPTPRLLAAAKDAGVKVTGTVADIRPYVAEAAVYVVPLRIGGGTRLKIFEALAMGKAVVSTTVGAEGLPLIPGTHFLQEDEPSGFARATISLLRDPIRRKALGAAGRRLVEERYSWGQVSEEFEAVCKEVTNHAR